MPRKAPKFDAYKDFDSRTIKLINYQRSAVRMTFFSKHRYKLIKPGDLSTEQIREKLVLMLESIDKQLFQLRTQFLDTSRQEAALYQQEAVIRGLLRNPHEFDFAISNYHRRYFYLYVNWKWHKGEEMYANDNEHLLNHQLDRSGQVTQERFNIIFVDTDQIYRPHPYQNKEIEKYLSSFVRERSQLDDLYWRRK